MHRAAIAVVALAVLSACSGGDERTAIARDDAPIVEAAEPIELGEPVEAYAVTYRVEVIEDDDVVVSEATLRVARPFRSRFEVDTTVRVADFGYFGEVEPGDETEVVTAVPTPAPGDVRADVLELGDVVATRTVLDRPCAVHRFGASVLTGLVVTGDLVEACIDADGLVLEEVTTVDGEIVERRVAIEVDTTPTLDAELFVIDGVRPRSPDDGGGSLRPVDPASRPPGLFFALDAAPSGFAHVGRYAMVPPQSARLDDVHTRSQYIAGMVEVWRRGVDVLVVEQGGTLGQVPPFGADPNGELVDDLGDVAGVGEVIRRPFGAEVRALIPPGRYVKVRGTLPIDELLAVARDLRRVEGDGTGLVYLDEEPG